jgi:hypothetical protein
MHLTAFRRLRFSNAWCEPRSIAGGIPRSGLRAGRLLSPRADVYPVRRYFMPSLNQHNMSRRGFCLCCMGATTLAATGGGLTPRQAFAKARNIVDLIRDDAAKVPIKIHKMRGNVSILEDAIPARNATAAVSRLVARLTSRSAAAFSRRRRSIIIAPTTTMMSPNRNSSLLPSMSLPRLDPAKAPSVPTTAKMRAHRQRTFLTRTWPAPIPQARRCRSRHGAEPRPQAKATAALPGWSRRRSVRAKPDKRSGS